MLKFIAPIALAAVLVAGCSSKVQQQRPPRVEDEDAMQEGGADMPEDTSDDTLEPAKEKVITPEERKAMCCTECATATKNDRSGDDPTKIPCVDFTADLTEPCLKWFRDNPLMASESAACAAPPKAAEGSSDAAGAGSAAQ